MEGEEERGGEGERFAHPPQQCLSRPRSLATLRPLETRARGPDIAQGVSGIVFSFSPSGSPRGELANVGSFRSGCVPHRPRVPEDIALGAGSGVDSRLPSN
jgi:hypothetical protein